MRQAGVAAPRHLFHNQQTSHPLEPQFPLSGRRHFALEHADNFPANLDTVATLACRSVLQSAKMEDRAGPASPALDGILERLQDFVSGSAAQRDAEELEFERRMAAIHTEDETRQREKEALETQIRSLQQRLQDLNREDAAKDGKIRQLRVERDAAAEKWERTREKWKGKISTAIVSMVRLSIHSAVYLGL